MVPFSSTFLTIIAILIEVGHNAYGCLGATSAARTNHPHHIASKVYMGLLTETAELPQANVSHLIFLSARPSGVEELGQQCLRLQNVTSRCVRKRVQARWVYTE